MANTDEPNLINFSSVGEPSKVLMDKYLKILKEFVASNDQDPRYATSSGLLGRLQD
ncbi:hypothetical protein JHK82_023023 [Glycine max]|nr:hypothetical protein JHK82_023023 [Glycine max]